jgi:hypothetical protein
LEEEIAHEFSLDKDKVHEFLDSFMEKNLKKKAKKSAYNIYQSENRKKLQEKLMKEKKITHDMPSKEKMKVVSREVSDRWKSIKKKPDYQTYIEKAKNINNEKQDTHTPYYTLVCLGVEYTDLLPREVKPLICNSSLKEIKHFAKSNKFSLQGKSKKEEIVEILFKKLDEITETIDEKELLRQKLSKTLSERYVKTGLWRQKDLDAKMEDFVKQYQQNKMTWSAYLEYLHETYFEEEEEEEEEEEVEEEEEEEVEEEEEEEEVEEEEEEEEVEEEVEEEEEWEDEDE